MIAATLPSSQFDGPSPSWRRALADAVKDLGELCELLDLDPSVIAHAAAHDFPLLAPRAYLARIRRGDPRDPLLLQILPVRAELDAAPGYVDDPVGDLDRRCARGVLQKYHGRALLVSTGACAIHCRYCFRRRFPYAQESALHQGWREALAHVARDAGVSEVILSGGDPLTLSDRRLQELTDALRELPHVRRLRIHTRLPVVLPERIDEGFLAWLRQVSLQKVVVIHANHAREIDEAAAAACRAIAGAGAAVLNQSVLLAGVNDSVDALADLSEALFAAGVSPYYLHLLDKVQGAAHFDVEEARAAALHRELAARISGYLVPRLVREVAGAPAKTPIRTA